MRKEIEKLRMQLKRLMEKKSVEKQEKCLEKADDS